MSLKKWFNEKWVDIGATEEEWFHAPCGRSKSASGSKESTQNASHLQKHYEDDKVPEEPLLLQKKS